MMYNTYLVIRKHPRLHHMKRVSGLSSGRFDAVGVFGEYKARLRAVGPIEFHLYIADESRMISLLFGTLASPLS